MYETPEEHARLQDLLDASIERAGPHLRGIITDDHRPTATELCDRLRGMCLLTVATVTADGRPVTAPVDGYFLHGSWWFSTSRTSVRAHHLAARPAVSATYVPDDRLGVSAQGTAALLDFPGPETGELRQAMLDHYLPLQGPAFEEWLDGMDDGVGIRIDATRLFAFTSD